MAGSSARSAKGLYIQVLLGAVLGAALGYFWPALAVWMQPFGDAFIKLVRMIIAPIVFVTVVVGIARLGPSPTCSAMPWRRSLSPGGKGCWICRTRGRSLIGPGAWKPRCWQTRGDKSGAASHSRIAKRQRI